MRVGILRETKNPSDRRVPLTPPQIVALEELYPDVEFVVQPSDFRCYSDEEYEYLNIPLKEDLRDCDILMGIKEVDKQTLIPGKTYLIFAHVAKEQPYNIAMFREIIDKKITLIDYEYLTSDAGNRVVAFGRYAGMVGAYNGLRAYGLKTGRFVLKAAHRCPDLREMWAGLNLLKLNPGVKILITGNGRVSHGAMETLCVGDIVRVKPGEFLTRDYDVPVFCMAGPEQYTRHKEGHKFSFNHFVKNPQEYETTFLPYTRVSDILITGHYWDPKAPLFFTKEDMKKPEFRISVIADISCDINGPIPSTFRPSTISDPFYDYDPHLGTEEPAFLKPANISVMAIDNLPGELPRDASRDFGDQLKDNVMHDLLTGNKSSTINRATITLKGLLQQKFKYLRDYLDGYI